MNIKSFKMNSYKIKKVIIISILILSCLIFIPLTNILTFSLFYPFLPKEDLLNSYAQSDDKFGGIILGIYSILAICSIISGILYLIKKRSVFFGINLISFILLLAFYFIRLFLYPIDFPG
jgi:hypothetical protein